MIRRSMSDDDDSDGHSHDAKKAPVPLTDDEFNELWTTTDFKTIVRASLIGEAPLRYRRLLIEARVAKAEYEMVQWTKYAVLAAVGASIVSLVLGAAALLR
jgi:hypothetical protein